MKNSICIFLLLVALLGVDSPAIAWTRGRKHLFVFGKAGANDPRAMRKIMEDSVAKIAKSYRSIDGTRFSIDDETRDQVVSGEWVMKRLDRYAATLDRDDTFVMYAHTHGTTKGMPVLGIKWEQLRDKLLVIPAKTVIVLIMTCHSGTLVDSFNAVRKRWSRRASRGRNLLVLTAVSATELGSPSVHSDVGNAFAYAVERAVKRRSERNSAHRRDGADGYSTRRSDWDGAIRRSGRVSLGELRAYVLDVTMWAQDRVAYYAHKPAKHPQAVGSFEAKAIFAEPGR